MQVWLFWTWLGQAMHGSGPASSQRMRRKWIVYCFIWWYLSVSGQSTDTWLGHTSSVCLYSLAPVDFWGTLALPQAHSLGTPKSHLNWFPWDEEGLSCPWQRNTGCLKWLALDYHLPLGRETFSSDHRNVILDTPCSGIIAPNWCACN